MATAIVLGVGALGVAGCGSSGLSSSDQQKFVTGCARTGQTKAGCTCLYTELTQNQHEDSISKLQNLMNQTQKAESENDPAGIPQQLRSAATACASKLHS